MTRIGFPIVCLQMPHELRNRCNHEEQLVAIVHPQTEDECIILRSTIGIIKSRNDIWYYHPNKDWTRHIDGKYAMKTINKYNCFIGYATESSLWHDEILCRRGRDVDPDRFMFGTVSQRDPRINIELILSSKRVGDFIYFYHTLKHEQENNFTMFIFDKCEQSYLDEELIYVHEITKENKVNNIYQLNMVEARVYWDFLVSTRKFVTGNRTKGLSSLTLDFMDKQCQIKADHFEHMRKIK